MVYDLIILGGGASALMTQALLKNHSILIIDNNPDIGKKVSISGGGRCNITNENVTVDNYLCDKKFVAPILERFDNNALMHFLHTRGLQTVVEKNHQYFCKSSAKALIKLLKDENPSTHYQLNTTIEKLDYNDCFRVQTDKGSFESRAILLATGGSSYPKIGATSIGLDIAEQFGHTIRPFEPVLVGLTLQPEQFWMKELSGIAIECKVTVNRKQFTDNVLFAHKGISGPAILSTSLYHKKGAITLDFLPHHKLKSLLKHPHKNISTQLPLPKRFIQYFLEAIGVPDTKVAALSPEEKERLSTIKSYAFSPAGNFGLSRAEATRGGIMTDAIDPNTMQSTLQKGLYFAGEVVDVTGELGGYNFQWAFSSAYVVARAIQTP